MSQDASMEENARKALRFARKVADETGTLMAGRICHSTIYDPSKPETEGLVCCIFKVRHHFRFQRIADKKCCVCLSGIDRMGCPRRSGLHHWRIFHASWRGEIGFGVYQGVWRRWVSLGAACSPTREYHGFLISGLASVITILPTPDLKTRDAVSLGEACMELESIGADVIGLNCSHDPDAYARLLTDLRPRCKCALAALPMGRQMADDGTLLLACFKNLVPKFSMFFLRFCFTVG